MPHSVLAAVLNTAPGKLDLEYLTLADPAPEQVRVRIVYAGLCHSDLHEMDGTFPTSVPILLGHEAAGVVEEVGSNVLGISPGDHVVTCLSIFCGQCSYCNSGRPTLCKHRQTLAQGDGDRRLINDSGDSVRPTAGIGAFAEQIVVHQHALAVIPRTMPLAQASILGCAVTTGFGAVHHSAGVRAGSTVAVIGTGGIGVSAIQAARISGASQIIAVDVVDEKLVRAAAFGATSVINAGSVDPVAAVHQLTGGGVEYSFEAVGNARTVAQSVAMLAPGGVATVVGMVPANPPIEIDGSDLFFTEKTLQGCFMGSNRFRTDVAAFVAMYQDGRLDLDAMISRTVPFADINVGFTELAGGTGTRTIVEIGAS